MTLDYFYGQAGELFSFYRIPKALFQEPRFQSLSTDAKTLYGILLDRMSLSVKNGWLDKQNRVFILFTIEDVKRVLCCADNKATKLLRELEKFGLIERKRRGQGKPSLVYVKNFSAESSKESVKNRDNDDSCGFKIACQDPAKWIMMKPGWRCSSKVPPPSASPTRCWNAAALSLPDGSTRTIFRQSTIFPPRMPSTPSAQPSAT